MFQEFVNNQHDSFSGCIRYLLLSRLVYTWTFSCSLNLLRGFKPKYPD